MYLKKSFFLGAVFILVFFVHFSAFGFQKREKAPLKCPPQPESLPQCQSDSERQSEVPPKKIRKNHEDSGCCTRKGVPPLSRFDLFGEFLYFKPIEGGMRYAVTGTVDESNNRIFVSPVPSPLPVSHSVIQKFEYVPAFRIGALGPVFDEWEVAGSWMRLHHNFPKTKVTDPNGLLYANLYSPAFGFSNELATSVKGSWRLYTDVFNLDVQRPFLLNESLQMNPIFGVQAFIIRQGINVSYTLINTDPTNPPVLSIGSLYNQQVKEHIKAWGVGPEIGTEVKMVLPQNWSFLLKGAFSLMSGRYSVKTAYPNLINYMVGSNNYRFEENCHRLFTMGQLKGGVSKYWEYDQIGSMEIILGWESQIWFEQQVSNWFSTYSLQSNSNLSFWGPFAMVALRF